jgi:hypothetical protein
MFQAIVLLLILISSNLSLANLKYCQDLFQNQTSNFEVVESISNNVEVETDHLDFRQVLSSTGFQGPNYRLVFNQFPTDPIENTKLAARTIKQMLSEMSPADRGLFENSIKGAWSTFQTYYNRGARLELRMLQFALQGVSQGSHSDPYRNAFSDRSEIKSWIRDICESDANKDELVIMGTFLREFDPQLVSLTNFYIAQQFPNADKKYNFSTPVAERDFRLAPKRSLSFLFKILNGWPEQLIAELEEAKSKPRAKSIVKVKPTTTNATKVKPSSINQLSPRAVAEAYRHFIQNTQKITKLAGSNFGQFDSGLIEDVIRGIQTELIEIRKENFGKVDQQGFEFQITLDGSFFNGLAANSGSFFSSYGSAGSDIDLFFDHPMLSKLFDRDSFKQRFAETFKAHGFTRMPLKLQNVALELPDELKNEKDITARLSQLGTVSFLITADSIELHVYPVTLVRTPIKPVIYNF